MVQNMFENFVKHGQSPNGTDIVPLLFIISPKNDTVLLNIGKDRHKPFKSVFIVPRGVPRCSTFGHFQGLSRVCREIGNRENQMRTGFLEAVL